MALASLTALAGDYYVVVPVKGKLQSVAGISVALGAYTLPEAVVGTAYAGFDFKTVLQVTGDATYAGTGVSYAAIGSLPTGLVLNPTTGILSGTPTASGTTSFQVQATYKTKSGQQAYQVVSLALTVSLASGAIADATVSSAYSYDLRAGKLSVSGDPAFGAGSSAAWAVTTGALPTGLALASGTGVISGTAGEFPYTGKSFGVSATYKGASANQTYTIYPKDASYTSVKLLFPFDGSAVESKGAAVTSSGVTYSSSILKYGSGSAYFGGATGAYVMAPAFFPVGDFTIEGWFYPTAASGVVLDVGGINNANWQPQSVMLNWPTAGQVNWLASSTNNGTDISAQTGCVMPSSCPTTFGAYNLNAWNHFAIVRSGVQYYLYLNGVRGAVVAKNVAPFNSGKNVVIGNYPSTTQANFPGASFPGYLDEFRFTDGVARYTGATYTLPTDTFPHR